MAQVTEVVAKGAELAHGVSEFQVSDLDRIISILLGTIFSLFFLSTAALDCGGKSRVSSGAPWVGGAHARPSGCMYD